MSTLYGTSITHYLTMGNGHIRQLLSPYKLGLSFTNQESRLQNRTFIYKWGVLGYKWDSQLTIYPNALNHNSICTLVLTKCNGYITIKVISTLHLGEER